MVVLRQGVQGISDLIYRPGMINLDFADVRTIMQDKGQAHMGIGRAKGEDKSRKAAEMAISSPLMDTSIEGAKGVLVNVCGGLDMTLYEFDAVSDIINNLADPEAEIIVGSSIDESLEDEIVVTVIATNFGGNKEENKMDDEDHAVEITSSEFKATKIEQAPQNEAAPVYTQPSYSQPTYSQPVSRPVAPVSGEAESEMDVPIDIPNFLQRRKKR